MSRALALALALGCGAEPPVHGEPEASEPMPVPVPVPMPVPPAAAPPVEHARWPPPSLVDVVLFVPHVRLAIGYATGENFTGAPLPGYGAARAWLHPAATDALASAAVDLASDGLAIVVFDAYRPRRASEAMVAWARANGRTDLLRDGWVAARSQHNRGLAIDVGLVDLVTGELLDMGTAWDAFDARSSTFAVRGDAGARRRRLRHAMQRVGFAPYDLEWWHFTWPANAPALDVPYGAGDR